MEHHFVQARPMTMTKKLGQGKHVMQKLSTANFDLWRLENGINTYRLQVQGWHIIITGELGALRLRLFYKMEGANEFSEINKTSIQVAKFVENLVCLGIRKYQTFAISWTLVKDQD